MARRTNGTDAHLSPAISEQRQDTEIDEMLIVAIDDNPDVLQLITTSLEQSPYRVVGIQDSTQAVSLIQELHPHAVTLDIMMPQVNGWQILHQLKSNPATAAIPIILLTVLEDRSAGYVLGADEYLVKPVARETLLTTLHQLTASQPIDGKIVSGDITHAQTVLAGNPAMSEYEHKDTLKHVVLVNHEANVHEIVEQLVTNSGYNLSTVESGQDITGLIERASPDLLMLFVQLKEQMGEGNVKVVTIESQAQPLDSLPSLENKRSEREISKET